jgi:hypothetical protein
MKLETRYTKVRAGGFTLDPTTTEAKVEHSQSARLGKSHRIQRAQRVIESQVDRLDSKLQREAKRKEVTERKAIATAKKEVYREKAKRRKAKQ